MSITTHVLDTRLGRPAIGVAAALEVKHEAGWSEIARAVTNEQGRITDWSSAKSLSTGTHRIRFATGSYFRSSGVTGFYPEVTVVFEITDASQHYHVPLLLSPFGYSTYRGS